MPFPDPSLAPPSLALWQMSFGGLVFGGINQASPYQLQTLTGIDGVDSESGDTQRSLDQGEFVGLDVLKGRDVTITQVIKETVSGPLVNLIANPNAANNVSDGGIEAFPAGSIATQGTVGYGADTTSFLVNSPTGATVDVRNSLNRFPVTPGVLYTASARFMPDASLAAPMARTVRVYIDYYDALGVRVGTAITGGDVQERVGEWVQAVATAYCPPTAVTAQIIARVVLPTSTENHYIGALQVLPGAVPPSYADGDTPGYYWAGTPNNSYSYRGYGPTQSLDAARQALGGVMAYGANIEQPLYIRTPSGVFACMARPRKHNFTIDTSMVFAKGGVATSLLHATDPRMYAAPTKSASVSLPAPLGGVTFPLTFPVSWGGGSVGGVLQVVNAGLFEMRPVLVVIGPCTNPTIQNLSIAGSPAITVNISLAAGDRLVIDTDFQSVVYTPFGSSGGSSRRSNLASTTTWFNLPPGLNQIEFTSSDGTAVAGTLTVQSADAYMSL